MYQYYFDEDKEIFDNEVSGTIHLMKMYQLTQWCLVMIQYICLHVNRKAKVKKVDEGMYNHKAFMTFLEFSTAELKRFEIRYENGYNLTNDIKYNRWKDQFHPEGIAV